MLRLRHDYVVRIDFKYYDNVATLQVVLLQCDIEGLNSNIKASAFHIIWFSLFIRDIKGNVHVM